MSLSSARKCLCQVLFVSLSLSFGTSVMCEFGLCLLLFAVYVYGGCVSFMFVVVWGGWYGVSA